MAEHSALNGSTKLVFGALAGAGTLLAGLLWVHLATVSQHSEALTSLKATVFSLDVRIGALERVVQDIDREQRIRVQRFANLEQQIALMQQLLQTQTMRLNTMSQRLLVINNRLDGKGAKEWLWNEDEAN